MDPVDVVDGDVGHHGTAEGIVLRISRVTDVDGMPPDKPVAVVVPVRVDAQALKEAERLGEVAGGKIGEVAGGKIGDAGPSDANSCELACGSVMTEMDPARAGRCPPPAAGTATTGSGGISLADLAGSDDAPHEAEATVANVDYWASWSLGLAAVLSSGVTVISDSTGQPPDPEQMAVVVNPGWLAVQPRELAAALGISRASGYEVARRGEIPCVRIGRRILVPRIALDRLLAAAPPNPRDGDDA